MDNVDNAYNRLINDFYGCYVNYDVSIEFEVDVANKIFEDCIKYQLDLNMFETHIDCSDLLGTGKFFAKECTRRYFKIKEFEGKFKDCSDITELFFKKLKGKTNGATLKEAIQNSKKDELTKKSIIDYFESIKAFNDPRTLPNELIPCYNKFMKEFCSHPKASYGNIVGTINNKVSAILIEALNSEVDVFTSFEVLINSSTIEDDLKIKSIKTAQKHLASTKEIKI